MKNFMSQKSRIEQRYTELGLRMTEIEKLLEAPKSKDVEDRAIEIEDTDVLEGIGVTSQREAGLLQAALARIEQGTYGYCLSCEEPISDARLEAVPYAPLCKQCAKNAESTAN
jgi:RNA polymerase-binding transcription factor DksA